MNSDKIIYTIYLAAFVISFALLLNPLKEYFEEKDWLSGFGIAFAVLLLSFGIILAAAGIAEYCSIIPI